MARRGLLTLEEAFERIIQDDPIQDLESDGDEADSESEGGATLWSRRKYFSYFSLYIYQYFICFEYIEHLRSLDGADDVGEPAAESVTNIVTDDEEPTTSAGKFVWLFKTFS